MKIESLSVHNFKIFQDLPPISFKNKILDEISDRFLILGDNGTGKTTILQAIAIPLALATRQIQRITDFPWIGFLPQRYQRWGSPTIELEISFTDNELEVTQEIAQRWHHSQPERPFTSPGNSKLVKLTLDGESCQANTASEYFQFCGRYYAIKLLETDSSVRSYFADLPGIFWFDQFRNLGSPSAIDINGRSHKTDIKDETKTGRVSFDVGVAQLRKYLNGWKLGQLTRTYSIDYLLELENLYKKVFPGRSFAGLEPMPDIDTPTPQDYFFLLNDGNRTYDITEMSGGEQSIFPILYQFVQKQIANSIVLIDEVDLNLHPSFAQLFVTQLPKISSTCQFILTTHSSAVSNVVSEADTYRLAGGTLCL